MLFIKLFSQSPACFQFDLKYFHPFRNAFIFGHIPIFPSLASKWIFLPLWNNVGSLIQSWLDCIKLHCSVIVICIMCKSDDITHAQKLLEACSRSCEKALLHGMFDYFSFTLDRYNVQMSGCSLCLFFFSLKRCGSVLVRLLLDWFLIMSCISFSWMLLTALSNSTFWFSGWYNFFIV